MGREEGKGGQRRWARQKDEIGEKKTKRNAAMGVVEV